VNALYSEFIETTLVRVTLDNGMYGWGEAQAPLAPRVSAVIVSDLLAPAIEGAEFDGGRARIEELWARMYQTMRVRGQTGGFMLDAISGVDLALWDLAGKLRGAPVAALLGAERRSVEAYLSGLPGGDTARAQRYRDEGFGVVKLFHDAGEERTLALTDQLLGAGWAVAVDALWRLKLPHAEEFLRQLERRSLRWLECPFPPDEVAPHRELNRSFRIPLALGESYRTMHELAPFLELENLSVLQPDLGRAGITGTLRMAQAGREIVPHVSIALGPQLAAAIHVSAALPNCRLCEYNPTVFETANRYVTEPLELCGPAYRVPDAPGLGIELRLEDLRPFMLSAQQTEVPR
jgi:galactonate dehydratase